MQIRDIQMLLASANYYSGAIDGDAGPLTLRGVGKASLLINRYLKISKECTSHPKRILFSEIR